MPFRGCGFRVQSHFMPGDGESPYRFKASPYSSHAVLMAALPGRGEGRKVLDLGCGNGYLGEILARRGYDVTGVERAEGVSAPFPPGVRLIHADLDQGLPDVGSGYSYVLCADILEHLREPLRLLRAVPGVMAGGGALLASLPNSGNLYFRLNILLGRFPQHDRGLFDRTHVRFYMWDGWRALFRAAGFRIERCHPTGIPVGLALPRWERASPVRAAERVSYDLARMWKTLFAYQFVVTARPEAP